jgi:hypothetical protein
MDTRRQTDFKKDTATELSGINEFLCKVAGSDSKILSQCQHEISRHARVGAIIISTALLAFVSMFFAVQTISDSTVVGFITGLLWGTIIFILDSYIVASFKKNDSKWTEFKILLPRLILAIILGCSISIPMELKFFETEIKDEIVSLKTERQSENQIKSNAKYNTEKLPYESERNELEAENKLLQDQIANATNEIGRLNDKMALEKSGKGLTSRVGIGPAYKDLQAQRDYLKNKTLPDLISINDPRIKTNISRIMKIDNQISLIPKPNPDNVKLTGLSSQMEALKRLTSRNTYVLIAYWVFFLLIIGIETAPIFVKFFTPKGSYDEILAMNEYVIQMEQKKRMSDLHQMINSEIEAIRSLTERKRTAQDTVNERLMIEIANAQGEIAEKAIRLWKEKQMRKVELSPDLFVRSNDEAPNHLPALQTGISLDENNNNL